MFFITKLGNTFSLHERNKVFYLKGYFSYILLNLLNFKIIRNDNNSYVTAAERRCSNNNILNIPP